MGVDNCSRDVMAFIKSTSRRDGVGIGIGIEMGLRRAGIRGSHGFDKHNSSRLSWKSQFLNDQLLSYSFLSEYLYMSNYINYRTMFGSLKKSDLPQFFFSSHTL